MCAHRLTTTDTSTQADADDLPQPRGLQPADVLVARSVLHCLAPAWTLDEHHDDADGALMLMLTPPGSEDTTPTYVLTQTPDGIQIASALGDSCDTLHTAPSIRRATWAALSSHNGSSGLLGRIEADLAQG